MTIGANVSDPRDTHGMHMTHAMFLNTNGTEGRTNQGRFHTSTNRDISSQSCHRRLFAARAIKKNLSPKTLTTTTPSAMVEAWTRSRAPRPAPADRPSRRGWRTLPNYPHQRQDRQIPSYRCHRESLQRARHAYTWTEELTCAVSRDRAINHRQLLAARLNRAAARHRECGTAAWTRRPYGWSRRAGFTSHTCTRRRQLEAARGPTAAERS